VAAMNELVATEEVQTDLLLLFVLCCFTCFCQVYVHNLGVVVKQWMPPLMEAAGSDVAVVFGNITLLESVNSQLLEVLVVCFHPFWFHLFVFFVL
jgi:hypothetical protein